MANLRNIFHQIMADAFFTELRAAMHPPRKNPALPQGKLRAFSLPQDSPAQLMFGAAHFGKPASSASRNLRFHIVRAEVIRRIASTTVASASISEGFWMLRDGASRRAA